MKDVGTLYKEVAGKPRQKMLDLISRYVSSGSLVFDVGCGTGKYLPALREAAGPTGQVIGIDPEESMLREARLVAKETGAQAVPGGFFELAQIVAKFGRPDVILSNFSLQFVDNPAAIKACFESLEKGGTMIAARPISEGGLHYPSPEHAQYKKRFEELILNKVREKRPDYKDKVFIDSPKITKESFASLFTSAGFNAIDSGAVENLRGSKDFANHFIISWRSRNMLPGIPVDERAEIVRGAAEELVAEFPNLTFPSKWAYVVARKGSG